MLKKRQIFTGEMRNDDDNNVIPLNAFDHMIFENVYGMKKMFTILSAQSGSLFTIAIQ